MNSRTRLLGELKYQAIEMRMDGSSYSEIQESIGHIPKGTLSGWLKKIELTADQNQRIHALMKEKGQQGRQKGAEINHQKRILRLKEISEDAASRYKKNLENPLFLAGVVLYLAEGTKKMERFQFMNSDPGLIILMINWIIEIGGVDFTKIKFRLYIHEPYKHENCESFWQSLLDASPESFQKTVYKSTLREYKKNPKYKGCLRIDLPGSKLYWETMAWRDCLYSTLE